MLFLKPKFVNVNANLCSPHVFLLYYHYSCKHFPKERRNTNMDKQYSKNMPPNI